MEFNLQKINKEIEIDGFNSIYYFEFGKDFSHLPESHDFWEMVYVDRGEINAITDGIGCTLRQGEAIFHKPNEIHAHISNQKTSNNMLVVSFTAHGKGLDFFEKKQITFGNTEKDLLRCFINEAKNALDKIPDEYDDKDALKFNEKKYASVQMLECYFTQLLLLLVRNSDKSGRSIFHNTQSHRLADESMYELILKYFNLHIYEMISLDDICKNFLIGKTQLCLLFAERAGLSPIECFLNMKMTESKFLLRDTELSVSQISDKIGYASIHNYSRAFRKMFDMTPTQYRSKVR